MSHVLHLEAFAGLRECEPDDVKVDAVDFGPALRLTKALLPSNAAGLEEGKHYTYMLGEAFDLCAPDEFIAWRDKIADAAGYPPRGRDYPDNWRRWTAQRQKLAPIVVYRGVEGVYGPHACRLLLRDLEAFAPTMRAAAARMSDRGAVLFLQICGGWLRALRTATPNGAVLVGLKSA